MHFSYTTASLRAKGSPCEKVEQVRVRSLSRPVVIESSKPVIWMSPENLVFTFSPGDAYIGPHPTFLLCKTFDPLGVLDRPIQMSRKAARDEMNGELLQAGAQVVGDHLQGEPLLLRMIGTGNHVACSQLKLHTPHFRQPGSGR